MADPVNPKVTASAVGGAIGGGTIATLFMWAMQSGFGMSAEQFTPERVVALTAGCSGIASFISGWLRKHGAE